MTVKTCQDLWGQCQSKAASVFEKHSLISHSGIPYPDPDRPDPQQEAKEAMALAIYWHGQDLLEVVYRWAHAEILEACRSGRTSRSSVRHLAEELQDFLRPLMADEIDAALENEGQCAGKSELEDKADG
jgi:hypothetical protein